MHTFQENERFVSKETVVLRQQECEALKFHTKQVHKVKFPPWVGGGNLAGVSSVNPLSLAQTSTSLSPLSGF